MAIPPSHTSGKSSDILLRYSLLLTTIRCHGGDVYYVFGNLVRSGEPLRDDVDLPFSQLIVDSLTSFVRTYNPNPDPNYLRAKNYLNTLTHLQTPDGVWEAVSSAGNPLRSLDWPSKQVPFKENAQCEALGRPLDYYS